MKSQQVLTIIITTLLIAQNMGSVTTFRKPAAIPDRQIQLEIEKVIPVKQVAPVITTENVAMAIPTDMQATDDANKIQEQILDHNIQNLVQGKYIKNSELMQSAQKVQDAMKPSVSFADENGVEHKVNLEVEAIQNIAKVQYTGYVETNVKYNSRSDQVEVSVSEKLSDNSKLSLEHSSQDDLSILKLNVDW